MTVPLTGSNALFDRLGRLIKASNDVRTLQTTITTDLANINDEYTDNPELVAGLNIELTAFINGNLALMESIRSAIVSTIIEMVHEDVSLPQKTLPNAMAELIEQMQDNTESINGSTVSASVSAISGSVGTGQCIVSLLSRYDKTLENVRGDSRGERLILTCTADAQVGGTAGRETFSVLGGAATAGRYTQAWPTGSGIAASIGVSDPSIDAGSSPGYNVLTNSDMEDWTSNVPRQWTIVVGSASTIQQSADEFRGVSSMLIIGTGAELTKIKQSFASGTGTRGRLKPKTRYSLGFWIKRGASAIAAGVARVSVQDGLGAVLNAADATRVDAAESVTVSGLTTSWEFRSVEFVTPEVLPSGLQVVIELTTAMTNTREIYIDDLYCTEMIQLGEAGAPFVLLIPGATPFIFGDRFSVAITNNDEGRFVRELDRFLAMYESGLLFPSNTAGSETILDSLIA